MAPFRIDGGNENLCWCTDLDRPASVTSLGALHSFEHVEWNRLRRSENKAMLPCHHGRLQLNPLIEQSEIYCHRYRHSAIDVIDGGRARRNSVQGAQRGSAIILSVNRQSWKCWNGLRQQHEGWLNVGSKGQQIYSGPTKLYMRL